MRFTVEVPDYVRYITVSFHAGLPDGEWDCYLGPQQPSWIVRGGPAPSLELAMLEGLAKFEQRRKAIAVADQVGRSNIEINLDDLGI